MEAESTHRTSDMAPIKGETLFSLVVCTAIILGPLLYIQHQYDAFTAEYGEAIEGAAGAGLALAVVFRTVSRTVLRTIVRTSARAGMRASLKTLFRSFFRVVLRQNSSQTVQRLQHVFEDSTAQPQGSVASRNLRSLLFASLLLYVSWIMVIGIGQPYTALMTREQAAEAEAIEQAEEAEILAMLYAEAREAWDAQQEVNQLEAEYRELKIALKNERDIEQQDVIEEELNLILLRQNAANRRLTDAKKASGNRVLAPGETSAEHETTRVPLFDAIQHALYTYAPYPGATSWSSATIWLGGLVVIFPMWLIFGLQSILARRQGNTLVHETGVDGGLIQIYFAAAFSFMPLTSDVIVKDASVQQRGEIAAIGLGVPTLISMVLWGLGQATGKPLFVFAADAFLIYPMVQIFPINPLEGLHLWRHNRLQWSVLFVIIIFLFLLMGSEALRSVI